MNNLIQRTLSGAVLVVLIVGSILWNQYSFAVLFSIITGFSVFEFHKLVNRQKDVDVSLAAAAAGGVLLFICSFLSASGTFPAVIFTVYGLYLISILIAELYRKKAHPIHDWAYFIFGQAYIALPFSLLSFILFAAGWQPLILLAVFVTIWVNDTGAYLTGITIGRHRLFERISPKKSWEGFIGGAVFALGSGYIFSLFIPQISLLQWLVFSEIIVIFGTFGDLVESLIKRTLEVKDSGNVIPGHGGILDRFDSMLLAAPVICMFLNLIFYN